MILLLLAILTKADVPRLSAPELRALMERGEAVAVDVRGTVPYELGHLPGARWMPLGVMNQRAGELPEDKLLVMYCTCKAEETSLEAAMLLTRLGLPRVAVLHGGYPAWLQAGLPSETQTMPAAVSCSAGLTSVEGAVTEYRRLHGKTVLRVGAEPITLLHGDGDDPSRFFLVHGTPFAHNDWNRIESQKGKMLPAMSAVAWICPDRPTIVDWRPGKR